MTIVEEIRNDPQQGAKRLDSEYRAGLTTLARRICHDDGDAAELVNHTFAEVIANIDRYAEQSAFFGWMSKILVNLHAKEKRRRSNQMLVFPGEVPECVDEDATERIYREVDASLLRDAVSELPQEMRDAVVLRYFMDLPLARVAKILSVPEGTVNSRLHYARLALAAKLGATAKKPGGKAVLLALLLCGLTALGAAITAALPDSGTSPASSRVSSSAEPPSSNLPQSPSGVAGSPQRGAEGGADFSQGEPMNITQTTRAAAMLAAGTMALAATASAGTYTWLASPNSGNWNNGAANWSDGTNDRVVWVNNQSTPNDAVFGSSSKTTVSVASTRYVDNLTIGGNAYTFNDTDKGSISVAGTLTLNADGTFNLPLASGRADGSLHFAGKDWQIGFLNATNSQASTYLEGNAFIAPKNDYCLGVVPASPTTNIFIDGAVTVFAGGHMTIHGNRTMRIASGKSLMTGSRQSITFKNQIVADNTPGYDYSRDTYILLRDTWNGPVTFDPGAGRTNSFGRLQNNKSRLVIASGVTEVTGPGGTGTNANLHVKGNGSSFEANIGSLLIDGGELYNPQTQNYWVDVNSYGQVTVTNGGRVYMPNAEWLNGLESPGRLTVAKDGVFDVGLLRLSQSKKVASEIHLDDGGTIRTSCLYIDKTNQCAKFAFNGGAIQSTAGTEYAQRAFTGGVGPNAKWELVTFTVGEKGAVFDTSNGVNIWWTRPLESGVSDGTDGGVTMRGSAKLVMTTNNTYTGATVIEGGCIQARVDNAIPAGTTLRLGGGTASFDAYTHDLESPARKTAQAFGRVEGSGVLYNMDASSVTGAVAPSADGTLTFATLCSLSGDYEVSANATKCSCLHFDAANQDISGLKLKLVIPANFDKTKKDGYMILEAPNGYAGHFDESALPSGWKVEYETSAAFLKFPQPFVITVR